MVTLQLAYSLSELAPKEFICFPCFSPYSPVLAPNQICVILNYKAWYSATGFAMRPGGDIKRFFEMRLEFMIDEYITEMS